MLRDGWVIPKADQQLQKGTDQTAGIKPEMAFEGSTGDSNEDDNGPTIADPNDKKP